MTEATQKGSFTQEDTPSHKEHNARLYILRIFYNNIGKRFTVSEPTVILVWIDLN